MNKKSIVWGACWFNESVDTVITFLNRTIDATINTGLDVHPVIFSAKHNQNIEDINKVKNSINNVIVIENRKDIYPNKNYGLYAIVNVAKKINANFVTVVDPDWSIEECDMFIKTVLSPLLNDEVDLVIPNIGYASGRSNLLVGTPAIELFYPEYKDLIVTPFPGSFAAITNKIYPIVEADNYHFDWGGEWDLISYSISKKLRITSKKVDVVNVRHRSNSSKILDAFQIWRAILSNPDIVKRINLLNINNSLIPFDNLSRKIIEKKYQVKELINLVIEYAENDTERQILYMVLYPLASILGEDIEINIKESDIAPYDKKEIHKASILAIYCVREALLNSNKSIEKINELAKNSIGKYFGDWTIENRKDARSEILKEIGEIL